MNQAFSETTLDEYQTLRKAIRDGEDSVWQARFDHDKLDFDLVILKK